MHIILRHTHTHTSIHVPILSSHHFPLSDTSRSIPNQIPQSSSRSGSQNGRWDSNKTSAMSHAISSAFSVSEWDNTPCTPSHGLVNQSQTEARSSGLPHPPRSRLESSTLHSTLPFSALNLIERDKMGQEITGQHLDTSALRIPASTSNQTCILSTTDGPNCETSPDSNGEGSMTEHQVRLNASHSPQSTFLRSDSKRHLGESQSPTMLFKRCSMTEHQVRLNASHSPQSTFLRSDSKRPTEVPSYFDTIFQHLLEVYNQAKSTKVSEPPIGNPVSLFLYDGFSKDPQKSSTDNKPQCKLPSLVQSNLSMDLLRPTNVWVGSNGTHSGVHHRNSVSSSSSCLMPEKRPTEGNTTAIFRPSECSLLVVLQNASKCLNQSETQVENDALPTSSMKTGNDFEPNSFGQSENGLTPTPESDATSIQTVPIPKLSQEASYFYYGLQLMAKSFMSRYLHSNPNEIETGSVMKARVSRRTTLEGNGYTGLTQKQRHVEARRARRTDRKVDQPRCRHTINIFRIHLVTILKHPSDTGMATINFDQGPHVCCSPTSMFREPSTNATTSGAKRRLHCQVYRRRIPGLSSVGMVLLTFGVRTSVLSGSSIPGTCGRSLSISSI
ncbi:hypothetical protein T265_07475 [Opisthorchis viverrini]|uniref:Uncharacterized protein n=1 Tax=Opisthorchis viverrini TaxID=6198 RepID=A0A074ZH08_OPIVI|nr:hypothetical protein T265_07475 [Opisthorchis viverrini]KER24967.1 hypothetical protein T265_07475 [Opisthorchis viverrini]